MIFMIPIADFANIRYLNII